MGIIAFIIFGGIAGWLASMIAGTNAEQGVGGNIVWGILGAFLGGFIMNAIGGDGITGFNIYSMLVAIGGAAVVLYLKNSMARG